MTRRTSWSRVLVTLVAMLALLGVACQGQRGGGEQAPGDGEEVTSLTAGRPVGFIYAPLMLANHLGYFEEEGLEVEEVIFESGGDMTAALVGRSVDMVTTGLERPAQLLEEGHRIKSLVGIMTAPVFAILGQPNLDAPVGDLEGTMQALRGLEVGIPGFGGAAHATTVTLLERAGMTEEDITMIEVGLGATAIAAMKQRAVQAYIAIEPDITQLEQMGYKLLFDVREPDQSGDLATLPTAGMLATEEWIEENEEVGSRFVRAIVRAHDFLNSDDPEVMEALAELFPELESDVLETVYQSSLPGFDPNVSRDGLELWQEALVSADILEEVVPYEEIVATQYEDEWE